MQRLLPCVGLLFAVGCTPTAAPPPMGDVALDAPSAAQPGWTGLTEPEEVIEARRLLMIETERLTRRIEGGLAAGSADVARLRDDATAIEAMLLALPHLFPPTTDLYDAAVLEPPTRALPAIWQSFDAFLAQAEAAETSAAALIAAADAESLRAAGARLRASCDACHVAFAKLYTPPVVTEEDLNFDFESVLPPQ